MEKSNSSDHGGVQCGEEARNSSVSTKAEELDVNRERLPQCGVGLAMMELDLCTPECLLGFSSKDPMVPCGMCDRWFHIRCLGLPEGGPRFIRGLYFCQDCLSDLREMRRLLSPQREREARLEAVEALVRALDVEHALTRELMKRTDVDLNPDDLVARLGSRTVDAGYAALLRESAEIKREMTEVVIAHEEDRRRRQLQRDADKRSLAMEALARKRGEAQTPAPEVPTEERTAADLAEETAADCPVGEVALSTPAAAFGHPSIQNWSAKGKNKCAVCAYPYKSLENLKSHLLRVHGLGMSLRCRVCQWQTPKYQPMMSHQMKRHGGRVGYSMMLVPAPGEVKTSAVAAAAIVKPKSKRVAAATSNFPPVSTNFATSTNRFHCPNLPCKRRYVQKRNLQMHLKICHPRDSQRRVAKSEPSTALSATSTADGFSEPPQQIAANPHVPASCSPGHDFSCHVCDTSYGRFEHLKRHLRLQHKLEILYRCVTCEMQFPIYDQLRGHLNELQGCRGKYRHVFRPCDSQAEPTVLTPYRCSVCSSRHVTSEELSEHQLSCQPVVAAGRLARPSSRETGALRALLSESKDGKVGRLKIFRGSEKQVRANTLNQRVRQNAIGNRASRFKGQARGKRNSCHLCDYNAKGNYVSLKRHLMSIHRIEVAFKCCGNDFSSYADLYRHQQETHGKRVRHSRVYRPASEELALATLRPFECNVCHATFRYSSRLTVHSQRHNPSDTTVLPSGSGEPCDTTSEAANHDGESNWGNSGTDRAETPAESKATPDKGDAKGGKRYGCHICDSLYESSGSVRKHLLRVHSIEVFYKCNLCQQEFSKYRQLFSHQTEHHGDNKGGHSKILRTKPAADSFRSDSVASQVSSRQSVREKPSAERRSVAATSVDSKATTNVCHICKIIMTRFDNLREHLLRIHRVMVLYSCKVCFKQFQAHASLRAHQFEKHSCYVGHTRVFKTTNTRTRDALLKPHKCHICERRCVQTSDLRRHLVSVHGITTTFECFECLQTYSTALELKTHQAESYHNGLRKNFSPAIRNKPCPKQSKQMARPAQASQSTNSDPLKRYKYECHVCHHKCKVVGNFKTHLKTHGIGFTYQCGECQLEFAAYIDMQHHQSTLLHKGSCKVFRTIGKDVSQLTWQLPNGRPKRKPGKHSSYRCRQCGQLIFGSDSFKLHSISCTGHASGEVDTASVMESWKGRARLVTGRAQCSHCAQNFPTKGRLLNHLGKVHPAQYAAKVCPFACEFCGRKFERRKSMCNHIAAHHRHLRDASRGRANMDLSSLGSGTEPENSWATLQEQPGDEWNNSELFQFRGVGNDDATSSATSEFGPVPIALSIADPTRHDEWATAAAIDFELDDKAIVRNPEEVLGDIEAQPDNWAPLFLLDTELQVDVLPS